MFHEKKMSLYDGCNDPEYENEEKYDFVIFSFHSAILPDVAMTFDGLCSFIRLSPLFIVKYEKKDAA